jgi:spore germination protein GerM
VKSRMVGMLFSIILISVPFGLGGCNTIKTAPPTESPSAAVTPTGTPTETPTPSDSPSLTPSPSTKPTLPPQTNQKPQVYWLSASQTKVALTPVEIKIPSTSGKTAQAQLTAAMEQLLKGPTDKAVTSTVPAETKLNSIEVQKDGVHVDLSKPFTSGGGSKSMQGRLGQVIYTASSINPTDPVWISVDGEPLKVLGGEGLEVSQPMTREEFAKNFPL